MKRNIGSENGVGILEILVAMFIFSVVAIGVSTYVRDAQNFSAVIEGATTCRNEVHSLIQDFASNTNLVITNYAPGASPGGTRNPPLGTLRTQVAYGSAPPYRNFQNIENAVTRALQLFANDGDYCDGNGGLGKEISIAEGNTAVFQNSSVFNQIDSTKRIVYLQVAPINLTTGVAACTTLPTSLNWAPLSNTNSASTLGFKIKVTIRPKTISDVSNNVGRMDTCTGEITAKYNSDHSNPSFSGAALTNCAAHTLTATFTSSEPGSLPECSDDGGTTWANCVGFTPSYGGTTALAISNAGPNQSTTTGTITLSGFPIPTVGTFTVRTRDIAGNISPVSDNITGNINCTDQDCVGGWDTCSPACGGTQTCVITQPQVGSGAACPCTAGDTQACGAPQNCNGTWSACVAGSQTFTITTPASCGGTACPASPAACALVCPPDCDCVGSWGACNGCPGTQLYTVSSPATGLGAACTEINGATQACGGTPQNCVISGYGPCVAAVRSPIVTTPAACGGTPCPAPQACSDCVGGWSACGVPYGNYRTCQIVSPPVNGGAACPCTSGALWDDSSCGGGSVYTCCSGSTVILGNPSCGCDNCYLSYGPPSYCPCNCPYPEMCDVGSNRVLNCSDPKWSGHRVEDIFGNGICSGFGPPITCP